MQEVILHSLKGSATYLVQILGQNATVKTILQKLETVYGAVESFDTNVKLPQSNPGQKMIKYKYSK